jgi:hypothetical protein
VVICGIGRHLITILTICQDGIIILLDFHSCTTYVEKIVFHTPL